LAINEVDTDINLSLLRQKTEDMLTSFLRQLTEVRVMIDDVGRSIDRERDERDKED
jgi:hypothetical protein